MQTAWANRASEVSFAVSNQQFPFRAGNDFLTSSDYLQTRTEHFKLNLQPTLKKSPRQRRLESDYAGIRILREQSTILDYKASGDPPQKYRLTFAGAGIFRNSRGQVKVSNSHEVLIEFGAAYPRLVPNLAWQTPIFHPNISNNGVVCLGGYGTHWVPSLTLSELCGMLWDMIRYRNFDTESPYNREAALWAKRQQHFAFPLDQRSIKDRISHPDAAGGIVETGIEVISDPPAESNDGIYFID